MSLFSRSNKGEVRRLAAVVFFFFWLYRTWLLHTSYVYRIYTYDVYDMFEVLRSIQG